MNAIITSGATVRLTVLQGQFKVSSGPRVELSTVLGSCVATCLYDPEIELGGMNHFLLPEPPSGRNPGEVDVHYGVYLMEMLINEMLSYGAHKNRLRAHLYGGANIRAGMQQIGTANAEFARGFLRSERIELVREDLGGANARRVDFRPASGKVRCRTVASSDAPEIQAPPMIRQAPRGEVELF
ncbi:chemotaxis protein CheD [Novosphingobium pentaromativorans]|uniref:Probable chemoreceptor glutamine deamidase CheD n=1 Tax=Novosphingobium pentaromativorans US6-1 TaxID=1088721 RepID=G6E911_9SPHN|nr:chemotaxis protein CheD [Novosphingobium pentaromativorans]AIT81166.1 chemotaxis protein CheD [Novosphingobium pentaromativorans US6-1]EHJ62235.1 chemotaxis protein CheD [Novosphingobium pentaromativorans US6-1]